MLESLGGSLEGLSLSNSGYANWGAPTTSSSSGSGFMPQSGAGHNNNINSIQNHDAIEAHDAISFQDTTTNNNPHHHNNEPLQPIVSSSNTNNTTNNNPIPITTSTSPTTPRIRGESIDIFLSTSPSQLDSGFLKFRNNDATTITNTNNSNSNNGTEAIPPLSLDAQQQQQQQPSSVNGLPPPPGMNNGTSTTNTTSNKQVVQQRDDCNRSPSCSVTGTSISSHSVSPSYSSQVVPEGGRRMVGNSAPVPVLPLGGTNQHHHHPHHIPHTSSSDGGGHRVGLPQQQQQQQQQHYQHPIQGSGTTTTAPYGSSQGGREEFGRGGGFSSSDGGYANRVGIVPSFAPATTFDAVSELGGDYNNPYSYAPTPAVGRDPHSLHPSFLSSHHSITGGSGGVGGQGPTSSLVSHHHQQRHDDFGNIMSNNANMNSNLLNLQQNNNTGHHQHHPHPSTSLGGSAVTVSNGGSQQHDPAPNSSSTNPQQQIFYVAVPTQDGQGQVLQPIQMVQLPGQPNAFVLPMGAQAQNIVAFNGTSGVINGTHVPSVHSSGSQGGGVGGANMMMATGASQQGIAGNSNNNGHNNDMDSHYVHPQSQTHGQKKNHRGGQRNNNVNGGRHSGAGQYGQAHRGGKNGGSGGGSVVGTHGTLPYGKQYYPQNGVAGGVGEVDSRMGLMGKQHHVDTTRQSPYNNHNNNNSNNNNSIASKSCGENGYRDQHGDITLIGSDEFDVASLHSSSGVNHSTGGSRDISSSNSLNGKNDFVASLYASPQRPPLQDLLGHVRRLSRDQVGCRLLQQSLDEEEGTNAATLILTEGLSFWGEAMVDPFGNYLFQKILEKITAEERIILVKSVSARLVNASLNLHGTRSVQKVVELCAVDEANSIAEQSCAKNAPAETAAEILSRALAPAAARLCIDSHGNHVIQRILLKLPYRYSHFVFNAVATSVGDVARHRHGCCVIQRCLDSSPSAARSNLVLKIVEKSLELMQDAYGNYVVQYVLDVCSDEDVHAVCESVVGKVNLLAIQKFSSNVMEKCLDRCTDRVREVYLTELSDSERIRELMMDPFGNYVIQRALAVATHAQAVLLVDAMKPHLTSSTGNNGGIRNTAGGRRIITKICRRFPNFNVGDGVMTMGIGEQERGRGGGHDPLENTSRQEVPFVRRRGGGGGTGHSQANGGNPFF